MFFLELVIVGRSLIEHSLELFHSSLRVLGLLMGVISLLSSVPGLLMGVIGLLPQLTVAAEQVFEQPLALAWIIKCS
jgi:hypothetical protein